jgi:hypothetical protein
VINQDACWLQVEAKINANSEIDEPTAASELPRLHICVTARAPLSHSSIATDNRRGIETQATRIVFVLSQVTATRRVVMRFLLTPNGTFGDIQPYLGIAETLCARGHQATFICNPYFADLIEGLGHELIPLRTVSELEEYLVPR